MPSPIMMTKVPTGAHSGLFTVVQRIRTTSERKGPDPTQIQINDQASEVRERKATSSAGLDQASEVDQAAEARRRWKENEAQQREKEADQREKEAEQKADNEKRHKEKHKPKDKDRGKYT